MDLNILPCSKTSLINRFNIADAFVVPEQGLSGGLWLLWNNVMEVNIIDSCPNFILTLCVHKNSLNKFGLICLYGDPHHQTTAKIWLQVQSFVEKYLNLPMLCMGDLNNIMNAKEKLGPRPADVRRISEFCCMVK